ncbi:MAG: hypothetical protein JO287_16980 [Pseudonocardiales bacterium]|nr:hypothetical protein [Pseudonocardiales bacterium]
MTPQHPFDSAAEGPSGATVTGSTRTAEAATRSVGLITQQVDVDEVGTNASPADATAATDTTLATTAPTNRAEQGHQGTARQQLGMLPIEVSQAQCV